MRYLAKLHRDPGGGPVGVAVVDLPGCFTVGDTISKALHHAEEAILCHVEGMIADGEPAPMPQSDPVIEPMEPGEFLAAVDVNLDRLALSDKTQRLNVTIPERALALIDIAAKRAGESRSRFLTQAALARIEHD